MWQPEMPAGVRILEKGPHLAARTPDDPSYARFARHTAAGSAAAIATRAAHPGAGRNSFTSAGYRCAAADPDGAAVDAEGYYWIAAVWGWSLLRYTPDGALDLVVRLPVQRPTKLAFGGADHRTVFVTSASLDLDEPQAQPLAGRLIAFDIGIQGLPTPELKAPHL